MNIRSAFIMYECPNCEEKVDEKDVEFDCPNCGKIDRGKGFYICKNCETLFTYEKILWECEFYHNQEIEGFDDFCRCPECGEILEDDSYCFNCGWPNNQGWIGEQY